MGQTLPSYCFIRSLLFLIFWGIWFHTASQRPATSLCSFAVHTRGPVPASHLHYTWRIHAFRGQLKHKQLHTILAVPRLHTSVNITNKALYTGSTKLSTKRLTMLDFFADIFFFFTWPIHALFYVTKCVTFYMCANDWCDFDFRAVNISYLILNHSRWSPDWNSGCSRKRRILASVVSMPARQETCK